MVIKLYISGISGNKEVKKKQQRVQMILDSKQISYEAIDITEPGKEKDKEFMQQNGKVRESLGKHPLPPQIFNDEDFCGDYEDFDMANEVDELEKFLHIETIPKDVENGTKQIEDDKSINSNCSFGKISNTSYDPYNYHTYKIKWDDVNGIQEEIISSGIPNDQSKSIEEFIKSEINGESEALPTSEQSVVEKTEATSGEVPDTVKEEEAPAEEKETANETQEEKEKETENEIEEEKEEEKEKVTENEENEKEEEEKEEEKEEIENKKEETEVEKPNEEETPHEEEAEVEETVDNENKEEENKEKEESENENEEEKEEEENDNKSESAESEKSQED